MIRRFKMRNWRLIDGETLMYFCGAFHTPSLANFPATATRCPGCRSILDVLESLAMEGMASRG